MILPLPDRRLRFLKPGQRFMLVRTRQFFTVAPGLRATGRHFVRRMVFDDKGEMHDLNVQSHVKPCHQPDQETPP